MDNDLYARAANVIKAKHNKATQRRRNAIDTAILGTVPVLAVAVAFASGWSLYDLGRHFHMPGWAAWAVFALIDVVWFQSAVVVIKNQRSPHRAIEAHRRMQGMFRVSVAANFAHGLILFGPTWSGFVAGAVFALFPIGFKVAFANAFPDFVKRARHAGFGQELADAFHTEVLMTIMAGVDQAKAELTGATTRPTVHLDRPDPIADRPQSTPVQAPDQPVNHIEPTPEAIPVHAAQTSVSRPGPGSPIDEQVGELLRRLKLGEHITKARAAEILGVPESTAYRRLTVATSQLNQYRGPAPTPAPAPPAGAAVTSGAHAVKISRAALAASIPLPRPADAAWTLTVPSLVSGAALIADAQYGTHAAAVEFIAAIATGSLSLTSFTRKLNTTLAWASGATAGVFVQAWVTTAVGGWTTLYAWLVSAGATAAARGVYRHHTRHDHLKLSMEQVRLDTALIRQQMAHHTLIQKTTPEPVQTGPDLTGRTVEETSLRTVVWELFQSELAGCTVERTRTGWTAVLDLPVDLDRDKLRTAWPKVANGLRVGGEFALEDGALTNQLIARFIDGDPLAQVIPYERTTPGRFTDPVLLGVDRFLNPVWLELAYNHTLVAGSSKFGKSTLVRSIAVQLADRPDTVLYGMDLKPGAPELTPMAPILQDVATTPEQAHALLDWLRQELDERGEILAQAGDQEWDPQKHGRPAIWVVEDELAELVRQGDDGPWKKNPATKKQESLLALMRFAGMHFLSATQQPSRKVFGGTTDARGNYANRLSTRMNDADHRRFIFGNTPGWEPGKLDQPGKFLLQSPVHQVPAPYKGMWLTGDEFRSEVARIGATTVRAPVGKRLILPAAGGTHQARVRNALTRYGNCTRRELEFATGLDERQVLKAIEGLKPEVERTDAGTWRLVPSGVWEAQAVSVPVER